MSGIVISFHGFRESRIVYSR